MRNGLLFAAIATSLSIATLTQAGTPPPTDGQANTQFRRTVDPSTRSASATASFRVDGLKQTAVVEIKGLGETDFGIFVGNTPTPDTNSLIQSVAPLDRTNEKTGAWMRKFTSGNGSAPLEFPVESLDLLSGGIILIGRAEDQLLVEGVTNVVNGVTNVIVGIPLFSSETNFVGTVLWAPIPPLVKDPSVFSFTGKDKLTIPTNPPPSPKAKGTIKVRFNAKTGQSVIDVRTSNLLRGQTYNVYIGDSTNQPPNILVPAGELTSNKGGSQHRFIRDTAFGDPLPQQARNITDLSGRQLDIRDNFGNRHLTITIP